MPAMPSQLGSLTEAGMTTDADTAERLRRALLDQGFYEAAAMVEGDIEAQAVEAGHEHDDEVTRATFKRVGGAESDGSLDYGDWAA
jgi:hypothetical protein